MKDPTLETTFVKSVLAVSARDRADGTRYVMRRHTWGFSETVFRFRTVNGHGRWDTITHTEHRTDGLRAALTEAREFVDNHSEPWYLAGQRLLKTIDEALK
jgi:hypothetical protein